MGEDLIDRAFRIRRDIESRTVTNLFAASRVLVYEEVVLGCGQPNRYRRIEIPKGDGFHLQPGTLYLGRTVEHTETRKHVPVLHARTSLAGGRVIIQRRQAVLGQAGIAAPGRSNDTASNRCEFTPGCKFARFLSQTVWRIRRPVKMINTQNIARSQRSLIAPRNSVTTFNRTQLETRTRAR